MKRESGQWHVKIGKKWIIAENLQDAFFILQCEFWGIK